MTACRRLSVFYPTRFHIFDQLATPVFTEKSDQLDIYSVYPPGYFSSERYAELASHNRTLWLGLGLRALMRVAGKMGARGTLARGLRSFYIAGCAAEFRLRMSAVRPGVVMASAGYLGNQVAALQRAGHQVVVNHGSLYEPAVRERMQALLSGTEDDNANWANPRLIARMDAEFAQADAVVVCSPTALASFPEALRAKVRVVPLGAPAMSAPATRPSRGAGTIFLHISNLSSGKNVARVLDAFAEIRRPEDQLLIGGPAPRNHALRRRLVQLEPGVRWLGRLDRAGVAKAMIGADIFVHPSYADGWGMVITEALAAGLPVVGSPFAGAASYYAGASEKGAASVLLADPFDSRAIAEAMAKFRDVLKANPGFLPVTPMSWADSADLLATALASLPEVRR